MPPEKVFGALGYLLNTSSKLKHEDMHITPVFATFFC